MRLNNLPVIVSCRNLDFVIVGPINLVSGMLVKTEGVPHKMVSVAKSIYTGYDFYYDNSELPEEGIKSGDYRGYNFVWSDVIENSVKSRINPAIRKNVDQRSFHLLMIYKYEHEWSFSVDNEGEGFVDHVFNRIAQGINDIVMEPDLSVHEMKHAIEWMMAPLLEFGDK